MKKCSKCKAEKPLSEFVKANTKDSGYGSYCKLCMREVSKINKRKNKEYYRDYNYKYRNGLIIPRGPMDLTGQRFGRLVVLYKSKSDKPSYPRWICICDCGEQKNVRQAHLRGGSTNSCGCLLKETKRYSDGQSDTNSIHLTYERNARNRNLSFELSPEEFKDLISRDCYYCGREPNQRWKSHKSSYVYNGIDRVNSSKGYTVDNTVPCCKFCNYAKRDMPVEDFIECCRKVVQKHAAVII